MMIKVVDHRQPHLAAQLHALQQAAYTVESQWLDYPALPPLAETVADLQNSPETFLVYQADDQLLGALSFNQVGVSVEIGRMVVNPSYFRQGIGRSLLVALIHLLPRGSYLRVSTAEKNLPAIKLYETMGFSLARRWMLPDGLALVELGQSLA